MGDAPRSDRSAPIDALGRSRRLAAAGAVVAWGAIALGAGAPGDHPRVVPPASETVYLFAGHGFGHGVGMSQWGARGAALKGLDATAILAHYYQGASITSRPAGDMKVLVADDVDAVKLTFGRAAIAAPERGPTVTVKPGTVTIRSSTSGLQVTDGDGTAIGDDWGTTVFGSGAPIGVDGVAYRGAVRVAARDGAVRVVNIVPMELYLRSVISREMSPEWAADSPEALKAQAIAARSYAMAAPRPGGEEFDVYDDQRSQVYGGVASEDPRTDAAVAATAGRVLTWRDDVIVAFYTSSSGGRTEDGANVFPSDSPTPYLTGVDDPYDEIAPLHRWPDPPMFTSAELQERLTTKRPVLQIRPTRFGSSPRVLEAIAWTLPLGGEPVTGAKLRAALELPDTWFEIVPRRRAPNGDPLPIAPGAPRADVWLAILNGSGVNGAAGRAAARAEAQGYRAVGAGDAPRTAGPSVVYAAAGAEEAATRVAADLAIPSVRPLSEAGGATADAPRGAQVIAVLGTG